MPDRLLRPPGQCLPEDQPHSVPVERAAGGIAADVRPERNTPIMGLKRRNIAEHFGQFGDPFRTVRLPESSMRWRILRISLLSVMTLPSLIAVWSSLISP